jgi:hypothetical protein
MRRTLVRFVVYAEGRNRWPAEVGGLIEVIFDIPERKQAEEAKGK